MASASLCPQSLRASLRPATRASLLAMSGAPPPHVSQVHHPTLSQPQSQATSVVATSHHLTHLHKSLQPHSQPQSHSLSQAQFQSQCGLPRQHRHHHTLRHHQCLASGTLRPLQASHSAPRFEISNSAPRFHFKSGPIAYSAPRSGTSSAGASPHSPGSTGAYASQQRANFAAFSSAVSAPASEDQAGAAADSAAESAARTNFLQVLRERGFVESVTSEELKNAAEAPLKVYCGFDPTAESLHLGNLLGIIALAWAVRCGHTAVALLGGATARVGDPSGKSAERPVMDEATIAKNTAGIRAILEGILRRQESAAQSGGQVEILNNYDWWQGVSLLEFLRDVGKYARVGTMMAKESVKKRLQSEDGMSYTEFTYQLLQGYDFVHLFREHRVTVQMGGSDQWGNITAGTDLIRRLEALSSPTSQSQAQTQSQESSGSDGSASNGSAAASHAGNDTDTDTDGGPSSGTGAGRPPVFGLTWPLLLKSDGSKFGKSESGAIWLAPAYLSPYKFYQYMFNTPDSDVVRFLRILTFLDMADVAAIEADMAREGYVPNSAQRRLAEEVTRFVHGEEGLQEALRATQALAPGAATALDVGTLEAIAEDAPSTSLELSTVLGKSVVDVAAASGLVASKGAGKRLVKQGGLYLNNVKVEGEERAVGEDDLVGGRMLLLASGKKNKMIVRIVS